MYHQHTVECGEDRSECAAAFAEVAPPTCDMVNSDGWDCGLPARYELIDLDDDRRFLTCETHRNVHLLMLADQSSAGITLHRLPEVVQRERPSTQCCFERCSQVATCKAGGEVYFPMCAEHFDYYLDLIGKGE